MGPEIKGYYHKGKVHTNSHGFNITSDGIRTETSKGITIVQDIFDGGSSLSNIKAAKNTIFAQRFILKDKEQEVFKDAIEIYADYATEKSNLELKKKNLHHRCGGTATHTICISTCPVQSTSSNLHHFPTCTILFFGI